MDSCHSFVSKRDTDRNFPHFRCSFDCLRRSSFVAAHELEMSVNDYLWRIDAPEAKRGRVGTLPFAVFVRREGILPSHIIPIIYVFTQNNHLPPPSPLRSLTPFHPAPC